MSKRYAWACEGTEDYIIPPTRCSASVASATRYGMLHNACALLAAIANSHAGIEVRSHAGFWISAVWCNPPSSQHTQAMRGATALLQSLNAGLAAQDPGDAVASAAAAVAEAEELGDALARTEELLGGEEEAELSRELEALVAAEAAAAAVPVAPTPVPVQTTAPSPPEAAGRPRVQQEAQPAATLAVAS